MFKKIMKKIMRKDKTENIIWPSSWNYEAVEMFNIMLSGMEKQPWKKVV